MSKEKRCNKSMLENRLNLVTGMLAENKTSSEIIKYCQENYQVTEKTCRLYIQYARKEVMDFLQADRTEIMSDFLLQYRALYQAAINKGDLNTAFKVLEKMQSLFGISALRDIDKEIEIEKENDKYSVIRPEKPVL